MKKHKHIFLKIISIYEILGGLAGVLLILIKIFPMLSRQADNPYVHVMYLIAIVFLAMFLVSILAGVFLWMNKGVGYFLSFLIQLLQIPFIISSSFVYIFIAGLNLSITFANTGLGLSFYFGSKFLFNMGHAVPGFKLGINLIAIFLVLWIGHAWKQSRKLKEA